MEFKIEKRLISNNFSEGRRKYPSQDNAPILAIGDHITGGNYPGCWYWMNNPAAKASAHLVITMDGRIIQLVDFMDTAWHMGIVNKPNWKLYEQMGYNPNRWTIGIEHENLGGGQLTEIQYQASLWAHNLLINMFSIPADSEHIVGHYRVDSVNRPYCPGVNFPWNRLFTDLRGGGGAVEPIRIEDQARVKTRLFGQRRTDGILVNVAGRATTYVPLIGFRESGHEVGWDQGNQEAYIEEKKEG